jgi:hypothetical protein
LKLRERGVARLPFASILLGLCCHEHAAHSPFIRRHAGR